MRHPIVTEDLENMATRDVPWDDLKGVTILISGAYGFLLAYIVELLLYLNESRSFGLKVIAEGRSEEKAKKRFAHYWDREDFVFLQQDVCDPVEYEGPIHYIIHGASWASPKYYGLDPVGVLKPNILGTYQLLELARAKDVKGFLFFSSAETYGQAEVIPTPETYRGSVDITAVRSCYAESKRMGETMCVAWLHNYGIPSTMLRIFHTYGPGMALDDGRVFADFVANIVESRDIEMKSDGSAMRAYCYLADAVIGMLLTLLKGKPGEAYNMGNDEQESTVLELAEMLVDLFPERKLKVIRAEQDRKGYLETKVNRACPATEKIRSQLGWTTDYDIREGFRRTVLSYLEPTYR